MKGFVKSGGLSTGQAISLFLKDESASHVHSNFCVFDLFFVMLCKGAEI